MTTILKACLLIGSCSQLITVAYSIILPKPYVHSYEISSSIVNNYGKTQITSCVVNPAHHSQEYTFQVVLPENAFITGYRMIIDNITYEAEVKEKEQAQKDYDNAVKAGQTAGLVAQKRDSKNFVDLVNIEAGKNVTCILSYEEVLVRKRKRYTYTINIVLEEIVRHVAVIITIEDILNVTNVKVLKFKTTNLVDENKKGIENPKAKKEFITHNKTRIVWKPTPKEQKQINATGLNGQVIVKYDAYDPNDTHTVVIDEDGYMGHWFRHNDSSKVLRKLIVFVLDVSGSMYGTKIDQLKQAMEKCLNDLNPKDYFTIVLFSEEVMIWKLHGDNRIELTAYYGGIYNETANVPVKPYHISRATKPNIAEAIDFIRSITSQGGTNIIGGLRHGIKAVNLGIQLSEDCEYKPEPIIVFLTDGLPNVEESDPEKIIEIVKELNKYRVAIYCLAFGYDADLVFLKSLALSNDGFSRRIYEDADADLQLYNFIEEISLIVLSDIRIVYYEKVNNITEIPKVLTKGGENMILGKVNPKRKISGYVIAISARGELKIPIPQDVVIIDYEPGLLEKVWAFKTIELYQDKYTVTKNETYKKKLIEIALKYHFVTQYTSLIVVKPDNSSLFDDQEGGGPPGVDGAGGSGPLASFGSIRVSGGLGKAAVAPQQQPGGTSGVIISPPYPETEIPPTSTPEEEYPEEIYKIPYTCVSWLNQTTAAVCPFIEPPKEVDEDYLIALNKGNASYSRCPDGSRCRHFVHCALNVFADDPKAYLPFKCHIAPIFLGVCCPFFC